MNKQILQSFLSSRGITCSDQQADQLEELMNETLKTNELFNLTAITDPSSFMEKMILDSALGLYATDLSKQKVLDVGTGAGFPGLVLYLLCPLMDLTLLDSTKKKIDYLNGYCQRKGFHISTVSDRVENYALSHREEYDYAYARAVAPLSILLETITPLLKVGGRLIAMKGPSGELEYIESREALKKLNCRLERVYSDTLPESQEIRNIIVIIKEKETPKKYPREYSEIKKNPLH